MTTTANRWCILRTGGQRTIPLMRSLAAAGYEVWTPVETRRRRRARSKATVEIDAPMMPTFVFARAERLADLLAAAAEVVSPHPSFSLFRHRDRFPLVADSEVERLRTAERKQTPKDRRQVFAPGAGVRVPEGPFGGMSGIVQRADDRWTLVAFGRVEVKIASFLLLDDAVQSGNPKGIAARAA